MAPDRSGSRSGRSCPSPGAGNPPAGEPADVYDVPVIGFGRIPARYNARGIEVDRSNPFALHAETTLTVAAGPHRFMLRSRNAARLVVDGQVVAETNLVKPNSSGNEDVPEVVPPEDPRWRYAAPGSQERIVPWTSDGQPHRVELWALVGGKKLRPETGELSVSVVAPGGLPVLVGGGSVPLTEEGWAAFIQAERRGSRPSTPPAAARPRGVKTLTGRPATTWPAAWPGPRSQGSPPRRAVNVVDRHVEPGTGPVGDAAFFRRLALDTIGQIPSAAEVEAFLADDAPDKRARAIDARLADPRWADAWLGYWQDVLAENPGILKPTLNNTGPFRRYLQGAFVDNMPVDRFATELIRMEGSPLGGGPAGFGIASQNDAPMAAKAQIVAKAFLAAEMKCARCHDAPFHPYDQADLFGLAGMLAGKPMAVPGTSTVKQQEGGRTPAVSVTLKEGEQVPPHWNLTEIGAETLPDGLELPAAASASPRDRLAALITSPTNPRFAPVVVNRLWKRYMGAGLVEPVDDWDNSPSIRHPELLAALARELTTHDYDLKHVARTDLQLPRLPGPGGCRLGAAGRADAAADDGRAARRLALRGRRQGVRRRGAEPRPRRPAAADRVPQPGDAAPGLGVHLDLERARPPRTVAAGGAERGRPAGDLRLAAVAARPDHRPRRGDHAAPARASGQRHRRRPDRPAFRRRRDHRALPRGPAGRVLDPCRSTCGSSRGPRATPRRAAWWRISAIPMRPGSCPAPRQPRGRRPRRGGSRGRTT